MAGHFSISAKELAATPPEAWPDDLIANRHLIYSSPAALSFNSPGAQGFGVKRAALTLPNSHMLLFSPGCCGRNTSAVGGPESSYGQRMHYLLLDETDIVTGRYLPRILEAGKEIVKTVTPRPEVLILCSTCVDALLGTDTDRLTRELSAETGIPVLAATMYALTREGHIPPMVGVRKTLYSLLEKRKKHADCMNILGFFTPLADSCELYPLLQKAGIRRIQELSRMPDLAAYKAMAEANFNLVLHPESRLAASFFAEELDIPSIELTRSFELAKIKAQYKLLGTILKVQLDDAPYYAHAKEMVERIRPLLAQTTFAVGETMNAEPFGLALSLVRMGGRVAEIFAEPGRASLPMIKALAAISPETRIASNLSPTMRYYKETAVDCAIGRDALYYHPHTFGFAFCEKAQPFGYQGLEALLQAITPLGEQGRSPREQTLAADFFPPNYQTSLEQKEPNSTSLRGLLHRLTPFAPDQSGAVSVLFGLGGLIVICDAGGCTGNLCGFDEPRWSAEPKALFSAGLRDMDAILGRDEELLRKIARSIGTKKPPFAALIGTPVPAVIGTDFAGLSKMAERRLSLPVLAIETTGTRYYDRGASQAYLALFEHFASGDATSSTPQKGRVGLLGLTPLDVPTHYKEALFATLRAEGATDIRAYGMEGTLPAFAEAGSVEYNIVLAPSGLMAAWYLKERFSTPYVCRFPVGFSLHVPQTAKKILLLHQQILANTLRESLWQTHTAKTIDVASFFLMHKSLLKPGDTLLQGEDDLAACIREGDYDCVIGDAFLARAVDAKTLSSVTWIDLPHFAVSGRSGLPTKKE